MLGDLEPANLVYRARTDEYAVLAGAGRDRYGDPTDFTLSLLDRVGERVAGPVSIGPQPRPAGSPLLGAIYAYDARDDRYLAAFWVGSDIELQPLAGDGDRLHAAVELTHMPSGMGSGPLALVYDDRHRTFLLVFFSGPTSGPPGTVDHCSMSAVALSIDGSPTSSPHELQSSFPCDDVPQRLTIPYDDRAGSFLFVWRAAKRLYVRRLTATGRLSGPRYRLGPHSRSFALGVDDIESVAFDDRLNRYVILGARGPRPSALVLEQLGVSGRPVHAGAQLIAPSDADGFVGKLAYARNPGELILGLSVVTGESEDTVGTDRMSVRRLTGGGGRVVGPALASAKAPAYDDPLGTEPFLVYNSHERKWLVMWLTGGGVAARLVPAGK